MTFKYNFYFQQLLGLECLRVARARNVEVFRVNSCKQVKVSSDRRVSSK